MNDKVNIKLNLVVNPYTDMYSQYSVDYYNYLQKHKQYYNNLQPCSIPQINPEFVKYQNKIQQDKFFNQDRIAISLTGPRTFKKLYQEPNVNKCQNVVTTNIIYDDKYLPPICEQGKKCECARCTDCNPQELVYNECNMKKYY
jgi:hypothetical protein